MSMRAAIQPRPKNSGKPSSHQKQETGWADRPCVDAHGAAGFAAALANGLRSALRRRGRGFGGRAIYPLAQFLAGLEVRHVLLGHLHLLARLRVAAGARRPVIQPEAAEAADLDAVAGEQRLGHRVENHLHRVLGVLRDQLRIALGEARDQFGLGHGGPSPLVAGPAYCCGFEPLLSSFARSSAPRLVAPALAAACSLRSCFIASVSSARSLALTDTLIDRFLRSTLMIIACTVSPSFKWVRRSSTRSRENSEARR